MERLVSQWSRPATLLAINLLLVMVWGFAGTGKVIDGRPGWFAEKFGGTILAQFPGLAASFWLLTAAEVGTGILAVGALVRREFLGQRPAAWLTAALVASLFVFVQLGFGQWLTHEFNATFQLFTYFGVTLVCLQYLQTCPSRPPSD